MNSVNLIGNLTADIKLETSNSQKHYTRFNLAVRRDADRTDFISCVAFGKTSEMLSSQLKGSKIGIAGSWQTGSYQNNQGQTIYTNECMVYRVDFLSPKASANLGVNNTQSEPTINQSASTNNNDSFANNDQAIDISDEDLPF